MSDLFSLDDQQLQDIKPRLPIKQRDPRRIDDRRVISGVVHVVRSGCRWGAAHESTALTPPTTVASIAGAHGAVASNLRRTGEFRLGAEPRDGR